MKKTDPEMNTAAPNETDPTYVSSDPMRVLQGMNLVLKGLQMMVNGIDSRAAEYLEEGKKTPEAPEKTSEAPKKQESGEIPEDDVLPFEPDPEKSEPEQTDPPQSVDPSQSVDSPQSEEPSQKGDASKKTITMDMLTKTVVSKLKLGKKYSDKINALVNSYGVSQLSALPEDKYESFLNELTEM